MLLERSPAFGLLRCLHTDCCCEGLFRVALAAKPLLLLLLLQADATEAMTSLTALGIGGGRHSGGRMRAQGKRGFELLSPAALYRLLQSGNQEVHTPRPVAAAAAVAASAAAIAKTWSSISKKLKLRVGCASVTNGVIPDGLPAAAACVSAGETGCYAVQNSWLGSFHVGASVSGTGERLSPSSLLQQVGCLRSLLRRAVVC